MTEIDDDEICKQCPERMRCLTDPDLATNIIVDGFALRPGCWAETTTQRRVLLQKDSMGVLYCWDEDAHAMVHTSSISFERRIIKPTTPLLCPYCGMSVYRLEPHLFVCRCKRRK